MIRSMTGYGNSITEQDGIVFRAEIRSLNSKGLDLNIRMPKSFSGHEIELRTRLGGILNRGKVSIYIDSEIAKDALGTQVINKELLIAYYKELVNIAEELNTGIDGIYQSILQNSQIFNLSTGEDPDEKLWPVAESAIMEALDKFNHFRDAEGKALEYEFKNYLTKIKQNLDQIDKIRDNRVERIREGLNEKLQSMIDDSRIDPYRLEQEMIFYTEKLDITEEIVRLNTHLQYFTDTMQEDSPGKKLSFISQEMGREINTIGSKANDATIQKCVVIMKDELEKIKEQVLNVL